MRTAFAHDSLAHGPGSFWTLDPLVLVPLALAGWLYSRGARSSWRRAGIGRGVRRWEAACFALGMSGLFFALVWPLDVLGEERFSLHMAQLIVMLNFAAPLLVLGAPLQVMVRALPAAWRRRAAHFVPRPGLVMAALLQQAVLWAWHTPRGIALSLESDAVHIAMHATLLVAALLFWTAVLRPRGARYWAPIAALLLTLKITGAVCIVMMLQDAVVYPAYDAGIDDEHLGWGFMMIAGTLSYLGAGVALVSVSFAALERTHAARPLRAR